MPSCVDDIIDVSFRNLERLRDVDGGLFFHIDSRNRVRGAKIIRYNARIMELLPKYSNVALFLSSCLSEVSGVCLGDVGLTITAMDRLGYGVIAKRLKAHIYGTSLVDLQKVVPDRICWILESCDIPELRSYVLEKRKLKHRYFGVDYVCVSAVLYAIHYLVVTGCYEEALVWYNFLVDKFWRKNGEWLLSYFPFLDFTYRKAFSVHQLGMAPLYLLELYEKTNEESILGVVQKSVDYGLQFLNGDRVYRNLRNKETRSYECAFDIKGLRMAKKYGVA